MPLALVVVTLMMQSSVAQPGATCQSPEFAQFDFWVGEWEVFDPKGARVGTNAITRTHSGCVVAEKWTGAGGLTGSSFNIYTPSTRRWHQVWVDSSGMLLELEGEFVDGAMRLQGKGLTAKGATMNRVTWTPHPDGSVRQFWEMSSDAGKTWQPAFDGSYRLLRVQHAMIQPDAIQWRGPANGLQTAVVEGNPQSAGPFTMMLKLPPGVWIQPHFHNVDKRLVVIKGELLMGHGDAVDEANVSVLKTGGVAVMPANTHHYEGGRGETVVALIATGPFTTTMVKK